MIRVNETELLLSFIFIRDLNVAIAINNFIVAIWYRFDVVFISDRKTFVIWYHFAVVFILTPNQMQNDII